MDFLREGGFLMCKTHSFLRARGRQHPVWRIYGEQEQWGKEGGKGSTSHRQIS